MLTSKIDEIEALRPLFVGLPDPVQVIFCLFLDAAHLFKAAGPPAPDLHRRNFVRGAFAFIDGASYVLKQYALVQCANGQAKYSAVEIAFLRDEARLPTGDELRAGFPRMDDNFYFAVKLVMQPWCPGLVINKTHVCWQQFKSALKVRHRVTHPKSMDGLAISDAEHFDACAALEWALAVVVDAGMRFVVALQQHPVGAPLVGTSLVADLTDAFSVITDMAPGILVYEALPN